MSHSRFIKIEQNIVFSHLGRGGFFKNIVSFSQDTFNELLSNLEMVRKEISGPTQRLVWG